MHLDPIAHVERSPRATCARVVVRCRAHETPSLSRSRRRSHVPLDSRASRSPRAGSACPALRRRARPRSVSNAKTSVRSRRARRTDWAQFSRTAHREPSEQLDYVRARQLVDRRTAALSPVIRSSCSLTPRLNHAAARLGEPRSRAKLGEARANLATPRGPLDRLDGLPSSPRSRPLHPFGEAAHDR